MRLGALCRKEGSTLSYAPKQTVRVACRSIVDTANGHEQLEQRGTGAVGFPLGPRGSATAQIRSGVPILSNERE